MDRHVAKEDPCMVFKTHVAFVDHVQEVLAPFLGDTGLLVPLPNTCRDHLRLLQLLHDHQVTQVVRTRWDLGDFCRLECSAV